MLATKPIVFVVKQNATRTVKIRTHVIHGHKLKNKTVCEGGSLYPRTCTISQTVIL